MKATISKLRTDLYDIEAAFAKQQFLLEIIRDYGEFNSENSDGVDKMTYLINILYLQQKRLRKSLDEYIPRLQRYFKTKHM